jgi:hypothetical protein
MSQAGSTGAGGGGGGPTVPTSFPTDKGTATPSTNQLIFHGVDGTDLIAIGVTPIFSLSTIQAYGGVAGTATANKVDLVLPNAYHGSVTTTNGTQTILVNVPYAITNGTINYQFTVTSYDITDNLGATQIWNISIRVTGGSAIALPDNVIIKHEDPTFPAAANIDFNRAVPGTIQIRVTGVSATTIEWACIGTQTQVGT